MNRLQAVRFLPDRKQNNLVNFRKFSVNFLDRTGEGGSGMEAGEWRE